MTDSSGLLEQARALSKAGRLDDSQKVYAQLVNTPGYEVEGLYGLGVVSMQKHELSRAQSFFQSALQRNPNHANSLFQLGEISARQQLREEAIQHYSRALAVNPQLAIARTRLEGLGMRTSSEPRSSPPTAVPNSLNSPAESQGPVGYSREMHSDPPGYNLSDAGSRALGGQYGVYELLRQDSSPLSKQAVELIDVLRMRRRLGFSARLGCVMNYLMFIVVAAVLGYVGLPLIFGVR